MSRIVVASNWQDFHGGYIECVEQDGKREHNGKTMFKKDVRHGGHQCYLLHETIDGSAAWCFVSPHQDLKPVMWKKLLNSKDTAPSPERAAWEKSVIKSIHWVSEDRSVDAIRCAQTRFIQREGVLRSGSDIIPDGSVMTVEEAKRKASELEHCQGFTFQGSPTDQPVRIFFKDKWDFVPGHDGWTSFEKPTEFIHLIRHDGVRCNGNGITDENMTVERAKRETCGSSECEGFSFSGLAMEQPVPISFKNNSKWETVQAPGWTSYQKFNPSKVDDGLFVDPEFRHDRSSLGHPPSIAQLEVQWIPVRKLSAEKWKLFDNIEPNDVLQGQLGDCWLVAAFAAMAEFSSEIKDLFRHSDVASGKYSIRLFDYKTKQMRDIVIDEFIPCHRRHWWDLHGKPLFARPNGNEGWVLLLEKAMAKLFGNYHELHGSMAAVAFRALTGASGTNRIFIWRKKTSGPTSGIYEKVHLDDESCTRIVCRRPPEETTADRLFEELLRYDQENFMMACSIDGSFEKLRKDGLKAGHAYSLLQVVKRDNYRLVCLRNPHGGNQVWNGPWSDRSSEWGRAPNLKQALRPVALDDGMFWMSWLDFQAIWSKVYVCPKQMRPNQSAEEHALASKQGRTAYMLPDGNLPVASVGPPLGSLVMPPRPTHKLDCAGKHGLHPQSAQRAQKCDHCHHSIQREGGYGCEFCDYFVCGLCVSRSPGVVRPSEAPPAPPGLFKSGTRVEYDCETRRQWIPTEVVMYDFAAKFYKLRDGQEAPASKIRIMEGPFPFPDGTEVEYYSFNFNRWFPDRVRSYDAATDMYNLPLVKPQARASQVRKKRNVAEPNSPLGPSTPMGLRKPTTRVTCENGHPLIIRTTPIKDYYCNGCRANLPKGSRVGSCQPCDFDLCVKCYDKGISGSASESLCSFGDAVEHAQLSNKPHDPYQAEILHVEHLLAGSFKQPEVIEIGGSLPRDRESSQQAREQACVRRLESCRQACDVM